MTLKTRVLGKLMLSDERGSLRVIEVDDLYGGRTRKVMLHMGGPGRPGPVMWSDGYYPGGLLPPLWKMPLMDEEEDWAVALLTEGEQEQ